MLIKWFFGIFGILTSYFLFALMLLGMLERDRFNTLVFILFAAIIFIFSGLKLEEAEKELNERKSMIKRRKMIREIQRKNEEFKNNGEFENKKEFWK
jgi:uncharacterized membrane protein (DUF106 family)